MAELTDVQSDLQTLAAELKQLEAEYNMFFAGRLPRPPWETRNRVAALVKTLGPRPHPVGRRIASSFDTLQRALPDVRRSLGSRPARARGGAGRARSRSRRRR